MRQAWSTMALIALLAPAVPAGEAAWRFAIERAGADGSDAVGVVEVWPQEDADPAVAVLVEGRQVGHRAVWRRSGDPLVLLFDARGARRAEVVLGGAPGEAPAWEPRAGLVCETRRWPGGPADRLEQVRRAWAEAPAFGADVVERVFHGYDPFGPHDDFMTRYAGWLRVERAGGYRFGTDSDDASFLLIDGEPVADWPGFHGPDSRRAQRHAGAVRLERGLHRLEYWHVQGHGGTVASAIWRPPGADGFAVMPREAFVHAARWAVRGAGRDGRPAPWASWTVAAHARDGDLLFAKLRLAAHGADDARWHLDDGAAAEGAVVEHVFARPGPRTVRVRLGGAERTLRVRVRERWHEPRAFHEETWRALRAALMARDPAGLPAADLAYLVRAAGRLDDHAWLRALAPAVAARAGELAPGHAEVCYELGLRAQDHRVRRLDAAERLLRAVHAQAGDPALRARAGVHLAGFLVQRRLDPGAGVAVLDAVAREHLDDGGRRLADIYRADADLLAGAVDRARRAYVAAGTVADRTDPRYLARRLARLEAAKDHLRRGAFDEAERELRAIEWETPLDRLGGETSLVLARAWLGRGEPELALARLRAVLGADPDDPLAPELWLARVEAALALGNRDEAERAAERLRVEHPYSEPAARVATLVGPPDPGGTP